jgi:hypothetical protein
MAGNLRVANQCDPDKADKRRGDQPGDEEYDGEGSELACRPQTNGPA